MIMNTKSRSLIFSNNDKTVQIPPAPPMHWNGSFYEADESTRDPHTRHKHCIRLTGRGGGGTHEAWGFTQAALDHKFGRHCPDDDYNRCMQFDVFHERFPKAFHPYEGGPDYIGESPIDLLMFTLHPNWEQWNELQTALQQI